MYDFYRLLCAVLVASLMLTKPICAFGQTSSSNNQSGLQQEAPENSQVNTPTSLTNKWSNYPWCEVNYPCPGCYPSAPACGTLTGVSYLSMGIAAALVVGLAAIILSSGESAHSHI